MRRGALPLEPEGFSASNEAVKDQVAGFGAAKEISRQSTARDALNMDLRITGGHARGRVLRHPVGRGVRPTSSRTREALFSLVGHDLGDCRFLDAYGGSGLIGIEAWSRGAAVTVVERHPATFRALQRRAQEVGVSWETVCGDVLKIVGALEPFDIVFADPPYRYEPGPVLAGLHEAVRGQLVYEAPKDAHMPDVIGHLELKKQRSYGSTQLVVYGPLGV
jgi:16S rRNA (guanine966-N2)-methyltransferase